MSWEAGEFEAFTKARLDEAEAAARELLRTAQDVSLKLKDPALLGRRMPGWHSWPDVEAMCTGRLADIEAMRAVLAMHHQPREDGTYDYVYPEALKFCSSCGPGDSWEAREHPDWFDEWPCTHARLIAEIWSDHPDFKGER